MSPTHTPRKKHWWQPLIQRAAASSFGSWLLPDWLHILDRPFLRLSRGSWCMTSILAGLEVVVLTTTGAKSGEPRTTPLAAFFDGDKVVLIASDFGSLHHPAWYYNLRANPEAILSISGQTGKYRAYEAAGEERDKYWQKAVSSYPGYEKYAKQAGGRTIPVLILTPMQ